MFRDSAVPWVRFAWRLAGGPIGGDLKIYDSCEFVELGILTSLFLRNMVPPLSGWIRARNVDP